MSVESLINCSSGCLFLFHPDGKGKKTSSQRKNKRIGSVRVMAHSVGTTPRHGYGNSSSPRTLTVPTIEQLLRASSEGSRWSGQKSTTYYRERDLEDHGGQDFHSKSVLAKVKDRARRWRQNLGKKKGIDHENGTGTPSWRVTLEEEEDDGEEDAEYLGAPMYESELAPEDCRENARQHPRANPVISENHILPNSPRLGDPLSTNSSFSPIKTTAVNRSVPTSDTTSMMQGLVIGPRRDVASIDRAGVCVARQNLASPAVNTRDKGVSMREYLSHKLEPGEDDRALSRGITNIMSPRKARGNANHPHDVSIVEKVKDAVSSLLHTRESSAGSSSNGYSASRRVLVTNPTPEVMEEESHGRILQAN